MPASTGGVPMFLSSHWPDMFEADERGVTGPLFEGIDGPGSGAADFTAQVQERAGPHPERDVGADWVIGGIEKGEVERGRLVGEGGG